MYPQIDLSYLAQRKLALRKRIQSRRSECADQLERVLHPVAQVEELWGKWKAISPLVKLGAIPVGLFVGRKLFPKSGSVISALVRWGPMAVNLFRSMR